MESSPIKRSIKSTVGTGQFSSGLSENQEAVLHRRSSIYTISLLEELPAKVCADDGSTTLRWWTWSQCVQTSTQIQLMAGHKKHTNLRAHPNLQVD